MALTLRHQRAQHLVQPSAEPSFMPGTGSKVRGTAAMGIPLLSGISPGMFTYTGIWIPSASRKARRSSLGSLLGKQETAEIRLAPIFITKYEIAAS